MGKLWVAIDYVYIENLDEEDEKRMGLGGEPPHESAFDNTGDLYRACMKEYGRCTSYVYVDGKDGKPKKIGWVFVKKAPNGEKGVQQTWVSVFSTPPRRVNEWQGGEYAKIG